MGHPAVVQINAKKSNRRSFGFAQDDIACFGDRGFPPMPRWNCVMDGAPGGGAD
jgi:hypothetical protein